jgi:regulator of RNase E activity RraA
MTGRYSSKILAGFRKVPTTTISDALDRLRISGGITGIFPVFPGTKVVGPAFGVKEIPRTAEISEFRVTEALDRAKPGNVIVFDVGGATRFSTWGGLASLSAKTKGIEAVVVNGAVRDVAEIRAIRFPVFSRSVVPITGKGRIATISINTPIEIEGIRINPEDLVIGDDDGIVIVPQESAEDVMQVAQKIRSDERKVEEAIAKGRSAAEVEQELSTRI